MQLSSSYSCVCVLLASGFDWEWDDHFKSSGAFLSCDNRKVSFHSDYSCGTAAIRGTKELADGQHFWEVKMTSPVYGTDMVGIILAVALNKHENVSVLSLMHERIISNSFFFFLPVLVLCFTGVDGGNRNFRGEPGEVQIQLWQPAGTR